MSENVVFVTFLYDFSIFITQKRGKSFTASHSPLFTQVLPMFFQNCPSISNTNWITRCASATCIGYIGI